MPQCCQGWPGEAIPKRREQEVVPGVETRAGWALRPQVWRPVARGQREAFFAAWGSLAAPVLNAPVCRQSSRRCQRQPEAQSAASRPLSHSGTRVSVLVRRQSPAHSRASGPRGSAASPRRSECPALWAATTTTTSTTRRSAARWGATLSSGTTTWTMLAVRLRARAARERPARRPLQLRSCLSERRCRPRLRQRCGAGGRPG